MEFIIVPNDSQDRLASLAGFDEMEAADDVKTTCCGG